MMMCCWLLKKIQTREKEMQGLLYYYCGEGREESILSTIQEHMFEDRNNNKEDIHKCSSIINISNKPSP
jgi:hypothetical protein